MTRLRQPPHLPRLFLCVSTAHGTPCTCKAPNDWTQTCSFCQRGDNIAGVGVASPTLVLLELSRTQRRTRDVPEVRSATRKEETTCAFSGSNHSDSAKQFMITTDEHEQHMSSPSSTARHHNEVQDRLQEKQTVSASKLFSMFASGQPCSSSPSNFTESKKLFDAGGAFQQQSSMAFRAEGLEGQENLDSMQRHCGIAWSNKGS